MDLAYPIIASAVILSLISVYREVINGVRYVKRATPTALTKIHKKLLKYISSYNDDIPEERTWVLQLYLKTGQLRML